MTSGEAWVRARRAILAAACALAVAAPAGAGPHRPMRSTWLWDAIEREAARAATAAGDLPSAAAQRSSARPRSWVRRHPAVFGAAVGAGAGAVSSIPRWNELYCAGGGDEDCLFHGGPGVLAGAGVGAGIGAVIGWLAGR